MLNSTITPEQIELVHTSLGIPNLVIAWIGFIIFFPLITLLLKSKHTNWGRFFWVWLLTSVLTAILIIFLIYSPNFILNLMDTIKSIF